MLPKLFYGILWFLSVFALAICFESYFARVNARPTGLKMAYRGSLQTPLAWLVGISAFAIGFRQSKRAVAKIPANPLISSRERPKRCSCSVSWTV